MKVGKLLKITLIKVTLFGSVIELVFIKKKLLLDFAIVRIELQKIINNINQIKAGIVAESKIRKSEIRQ